MDSGKLKVRGFRLTPIALAIAAMGFAAAPAVFAANVSASATNGQAIAGTTVHEGNGNGSPTTPVTITATVGGNALKNASGNISANVASGGSNQQANTTVVADTPANGGVTASATNQQSTGGLKVTTAPLPRAPASEQPNTIIGAPVVTNTATVGGNAFQGANGIVSASVASGAGNLQGNATAAAQVTGTEGATKVSARADQKMGVGGATVSLQTATDDSTTLGGNAFQGTSGVVNANLASGIVNQQANSVAAVDSAEGNATTSSANVSQASDNVGSMVNATPGEGSGLQDQNNDIASSVQGGNAFEHATGVVNVNQASGNANQQANTVSVAAGAGVVNAGANVHQSMLRNQVSAVAGQDGTSPEPSLNTTVGGNAFENASGNISDNVATGEDNQQGNATSVTTSSKQFSGSMGNAYVTQSQAANSTDFGYDAGPNVDTTIGGNAFKSASGNISANAATGIENQEGNSTSVMQQTSPSGGMPMAFINQTQDPSTGPGENNLGVRVNATLGGHAFEGTSGNAQVNEAAGSNNQQGNATSIASVNTYQPANGGAVGSDMGGVTQSMDAVPDAGDGEPATANVGGFVFKGASGNMNVNVAAGHSNQQGNATTILASSELSSQVTGHGSQQDSEIGGVVGSEPASATLGGDAFEGATGNVGVNIAAGSGNMQSNTLTVVGPSVH